MGADHDDFKKSGLAQKAFRKDRSIAIATFQYHYYSVKKLKSDEPYQSSGFHSVQLISKSQASPMFLVRWANVFVCEISPGFFSHEARVLMEVLGR